MRLVDADSIPYSPEDIGHKDEIGIRRKNIVQVTTKDTVDNVPTVEAIPKADYETRLKADLESILVELQLEIEEIEINNNVLSGFESVSKTSAFYEGVSASSKVIQQKINELKEDQEGKNEISVLKRT